MKDFLIIYRKDNTANKTEYAQFNSNNKLTGWTEAENEATKLKATNPAGQGLWRVTPKVLSNSKHTLLCL